MLDASRLESAKVVVELGPGTGAFTREILKRIAPETIFICIEVNPSFHGRLKVLFKPEFSKRHLVHDSAENLGEILDRFGCPFVDTVISALPYSLLPSPLCQKILINVTSRMKPESEFLTVLYSMTKRPIFGQFFTRQEWHWVLCNLPPAYFAKMAL